MRSLCASLALVAALAVPAVAQVGGGSTSSDHSTTAKGGTTIRPRIISLQAGGSVALPATSTFTATGRVEFTSATLVLPPGGILQVGFTSSTATGTGTTDMVWDGTPPQITEGDQVLASTFTPRSSTSRLLITAQAWLSEDSNVSQSAFLCCLFRDATATTIGGCEPGDSALPGSPTLPFDNFAYKGATTISSNATTPTVISMRCGLMGPGAGATMRWNGYSGAQILGGGLVTQITVTEIQ